MEDFTMLYKVTRPNSDYGVPFRFEAEEVVARFLNDTGAPALFEVTAVLVSGAHLPAVNGKRWLENYQLDQLRRAALDNTAPDADAPIYTCAEPPAWHYDATRVATVFSFLQHVPTSALNVVTVTEALTMAISGIVRYQNLVKETTDFATVSDYVWALIRSKRTG
jgi:hypothetical protein